MNIRSGLDVLVDDGFRRLRGQHVGLVTHPAAVNRNYRTAAELFHEAKEVKLVTLFGPEHGFTGSAQDLEGVADGASPFPGVECHSLYGDTVETLRPTPRQLAGLDVLVIDMLDVGARYYTFTATMCYCLEEAAKIGLRVLILDRPNPLGGTIVEGPTLRPGFESFIGPHPVCTRHGLTMAELALLFISERNIGVKLEMILCEGWRRDGAISEHELSWVMPSPNMPTIDTAYVYPGMCLIEGTNLSEGRGTTRPFELVGFPGVDSYRMAKSLNGDCLPGVQFRPANFRPTFQKCKDQPCGGVQLHVTDRSLFHSVRTGLAVLTAFRRDAPGFSWRTEEYEFVKDPIAIDLLFGSDRERRGLEAGASWRELAAGWDVEEQTFRDRRMQYQLY